MSSKVSPPSKITIADVAALAGVSRAIASRALSPEDRPVSAEKKARVLAAAEQLGFKPNLIARSLKSRTLNLVAVIVNHIHDFSDLVLFDRLIAAIQDTGKQVVLLRVGSLDRVEEFLRNGVAWHVDAALVFSDFADAASVRTMFRNDRVIMLNGLHDQNAPSIVADEATPIAAAVAHAKARGKTRAVLVTGRQTSPVEQARIAAYRAAFSALGLQLLAEHAGDYSYESGRALSSDVLAEGPEAAIFTTADAMAMGVVDAGRATIASRAGDWAFYGFDALPLARSEAYPISSISYDLDQFIGKVLEFLTTPGLFEDGAGVITIPGNFMPHPSCGGPAAFERWPAEG
ncbi:LacI family DNA-binding transcriptional regulator [Pannonibacter sp.]|uniref:LacI family DNA-binding transcriptional regulator n=1 Tax=Pannonibacter sp. TaxID=1906786 RepID=UPI003F701292